MNARALDLALTARANRWGSRRSVVRFFAVISRLGDGWIWYGLIALLAMGGGFTGLVAATVLAGTGLLAVTLYAALKRLTRRPRPFRAAQGIVAHIAPLDEYSFPSGHTLHAVSFTVVACSYIPALALLLVPFTILIGASRVVLGLHYPSDVAAATVIGGALGSIAVAVGRALLPM